MRSRSKGGLVPWRKESNCAAPLLWMFAVSTTKFVPAIVPLACPSGILALATSSVQVAGRTGNGFGAAAAAGGGAGLAAAAASAFAFSRLALHLSYLMIRPTP